MSKRELRQRIYPYLTCETATRLDSYAAATHTTQSAIVEAAVRQYLDGTSDLTVLMRRLDREMRMLERVRRDVLLLTEAFATWVRLWYAYMPEVPDEAKPHAQRAAARRFAAFIQTVAGRVGRGRSIFDELPTDRIGDAEELDRARAAHASSGSPCNEEMST